MLADFWSAAGRRKPAVFLKQMIYLGHGHSGILVSAAIRARTRRRAIRMLGARVFEKPPVVLDGARRLICLIVQLGKIVMRGGISRRNGSAPRAVFPWPRRAGRRWPVGEREIDERIEIRRVERERRLKLCRGLVGSSQHQQRDTVVVVGPAVPRLDDDGALQLACRFLEQTLFLVEQPEIVVRLRVQIVPVEQGTVVLERVLEVARPMVVERALEIAVAATRLNSALGCWAVAGSAAVSRRWRRSGITGGDSRQRETRPRQVADDGAGWGTALVQARAVAASGPGSACRPDSCASQASRRRPGQEAGRTSENNGRPAAPTRARRVAQRREEGVSMRRSRRVRPI